MSRRRGTLLIAALLTLAGCGSSATAQQATTAAPASAPTTAAPTSSAPTTVADTAQDTLLGSDTSEIDTLLTQDTTADTVELPLPENPPPPNLSVPRKQLGTIDIPDISISEPLLEGVSLPTLDKGPGHWPGTAMPGQIGNVVVGGHRESHSHPFRDLDKLKVGGQVIFTINGGKYVYTVRETQIVTPHDLWIVEQSPEKTATLFACHPRGSTKYRIVVFLDYSPSLSTPVA